MFGQSVPLARDSRGCRRRWRGTRRGNVELSLVAIWEGGGSVSMRSTGTELNTSGVRLYDRVRREPPEPEGEIVV